MSDQTPIEIETQPRAALERLQHMANHSTAGGYPRIIPNEQGGVYKRSVNDDALALSMALDRLERLEQETATLRTQNMHLIAEAYSHNLWQDQTKDVLHHFVKAAVGQVLGTWVCTGCFVTAATRAGLDHKPDCKMLLARTLLGIA